AQQGVIIKRMVKDLNLNVEVVICPIVREKDGLAMSSRNAYLQAEERAAATCLFRALERARKLVDEGETKSGDIARAVTEVISDEPLAKLEYVEIVDIDNLDPKENIAGETLLALAVRVGSARLIDNIVLKPSQERRT
ncbi:pantoate--beta-alanine ligase, partial [Acidobacteriota bacterium]